MILVATGLSQLVTELETRAFAVRALQAGAEPVAHRFTAHSRMLSASPACHRDRFR
jgi:hypothetical protein